MFQSTYPQTAKARTKRVEKAQRRKAQTTRGQLFATIHRASLRQGGIL